MPADFQLIFGLMKGSARKCLLNLVIGMMEKKWSSSDVGFSSLDAHRRHADYGGILLSTLEREQLSLSTPKFVM